MEADQHRIDHRLDHIDTRIGQLEGFASQAGERLARIEERLEHTATRADISELHREMQKNAADTVRWIVGTAIGITVSGITVMTFVLNNAVPKPAPAAAPAPIVIYLQPQDTGAEKKKGPDPKI
ncbi:hypothetical protein ACLB1G_05645 [Oxalobacteraceae bacterium A2-2]